MSFCGILAAGVILTLAQAQSVDAIKAKAMERRSYSDDKSQRLLECDLSNKLHGALESWLQEKGPMQAAACEQVINRLITEGKPSVEAYFLAAKVSELIGEPGEAVTILRKVLEVHPDGWTPGVPIPIAVSANMWLGRLYKEGGEAGAADDAFSAAAAAAAGVPEEGPRTLCNLYLAEVQADLLGEEDKAKETLASVAEAKSSVARGGLDGVTILAEWAKQRLEVINGASRATLGCSPDYASLIPMLVSQQLDLVGILNEPRADFYIGGSTRRRLFGLSAETALKTARGDMDRDALRLILGAVWMDAKEYAKAEAVLLELREANSYLSPVAGLDLARCQFAQGKQDQAAATLDAVKQQWPSYEKTVEECRKSAASPGQAGK